MLSKSASKSMNQKIMIGIVIVIIVGTAACSSSGTQIPPTQTKLGSVFEIAPEEGSHILGVYWDKQGNRV